MSHFRALSRGLLMRPQALFAPSSTLTSRFIRPFTATSSLSTLSNRTCIHSIAIIRPSAQPSITSRYLSTQPNKDPILAQAEQNVPLGKDHHYYPPVPKDAEAPVDANGGLLSGLNLSNVPFTPRVLGVAGLIPFVSITAVAVVVPESLAVLQEVQLIYSSTILSFMGAVHWGLAMANYGHSTPNISRYVVSVLPPLLSFFSIVLLPTSSAVLAHAVGFVGLLGYDLQVGREGLTPKWYPGLRILLTTGVVGSLVGTLLIGYNSPRAS
ncbi:hypothetical protein HDU97_006797 [Phlyctochytrium planicorne]|nr:hypothetical protein HDU97_006797 [Phlyctochytrium planicorne]